MKQLSLLSFPLAVGAALFLACVSSHAQPYTQERIQQEREARAAEFRAKMEQLRVQREAEARAAHPIKSNPPRSAEQIHAEHKAHLEHGLDDARQKFQQTAANRMQDPVAYFNGLLNLASRYHENQQQPTAYQYLNTAISMYCSESGRSLPDTSIDWMWREMYIVPDDQLETELITVFRIAEFRSAASKDEKSWHTLDNQLVGALNRPRGKPFPDPLAFWQKLIDIRSAARGANNPALYVLLHRYAEACVRLKDPSRAEAFYARANALNATVDVNNKATDQLHLAQFYLRNKQYVKSEYAWNLALKTYGNPEHAARSFSTLINNYKSDKRPLDAEKLTYAILAKHDKALTQGIEPNLVDLFDSDIKTSAFARAISLAQARVTDAPTDDPLLSEWQMRLSNAYLANGQIDQSNKILEQTKQSLAARGTPVDPLLRDRDEWLGPIRKQSKSGSDNTAPPTAVPPRTSANVKQLQSPTQVRLRFQLLAATEMRFEHNTSFYCNSGLRQPPFPFGPTDCTSICCNGDILKTSNLIFRGTIYENDDSSLNVQAKILPHRTGGGGTAGPGGPGGPGNQNANQRQSIPEGTFPLAPTPQAPSDAIPLTRGVSITGGDYIATSLDNLQTINLDKDGRVRLFLRDGSDSPSVFEGPRTMVNRDPKSFVLFYNGIRTIRLGSAQFCGVVYAPYATVEVPFNTAVVGAIVANKIIGAGNNRFEFDPSLINFQL